MKTAPLTPEFLDQMCDQTKFKPFKVKFVQSPNSGLKLSEKTPYLVTDVEYSTAFRFYVFTIGANKYRSHHFRLVVDQPDHSVTDETIKEIPIPSGSVKAGDVINVIAKFKAEEIDNKLKQLNDSFELEFKYFEPTKPHPDNATVTTLIQYVSDHREAMTKESILHFANLIGLIKLGAL